MIANFSGDLKKRNEYVFAKIAAELCVNYPAMSIKICEYGAMT